MREKRNLRDAKMLDRREDRKDEELEYQHMAFGKKKKKHYPYSL